VSNLLGRYAFTLPDRIARGELRQLRDPNKPLMSPKCPYLVILFRCYSNPKDLCVGSFQFLVGHMFDNLDVRLFDVEDSKGFYRFVRLYATGEHPADDLTKRGRSNCCWHNITLAKIEKSSIGSNPALNDLGINGYHYRGDSGWRD
jgi:hypothetical protein